MRGMTRSRWVPEGTLSRRSLLTASAVGAAGALLPDLARPARRAVPPRGGGRVRGQLPRRVPLHGPRPVDERPAAAGLDRRRVPLLLPLQRRLPRRAARPPAPPGAWPPAPTWSPSPTAGSPCRRTRPPTATSGPARRWSTRQHGRLRRGRGDRHRHHGARRRSPRRSTCTTRPTAAAPSRNHGTDPVLPNPGVRDFRDPKVIRDEERGRWVMALAENDKSASTTPPTSSRGRTSAASSRAASASWSAPTCSASPADDGTCEVGAGRRAPTARASGLPNTYAYWTGSFDGTTFTADASDPQWLDHGWDWYGAVTFEKRDANGGPVDPAARYAIGWMNNWDYANTTPTIDCDGFNGTDSIVREVTLKQASSGTYYLASRPVAGPGRPCLAHRGPRRHDGRRHPTCSTTRVRLRGDRPRSPGTN